MSGIRLPYLLFLGDERRPALGARVDEHVLLHALGRGEGDHPRRTAVALDRRAVLAGIDRVELVERRERELVLVERHPIAVDEAEDPQAHPRDPRLELGELLLGVAALPRGDAVLVEEHAVGLGGLDEPPDLLVGPREVEQRQRPRGELVAALERLGGPGPVPAPRGRDAGLELIACQRSLGRGLRGGPAGRPEERDRERGGERAPHGHLRVAIGHSPDAQRFRRPAGSHASPLPSTGRSVIASS